MSSSHYIITNRDFRQDRKDGGYSLGDKQNRKGAKELRLFKATRRSSGGDWHIDILPDRVSRQAIEERGLGGLWPKRPNKRYAGSHLVAGDVVRRLREHQSNLVILIHGYNNNVIDALNRAHGISQRYGVEVVVFSWPANGGGERLFEGLHGKASYLSDKSDARASTEALDRALNRLGVLMTELNEGVYEDIAAEARARHGGNRDAVRAAIARGLEQQACPFKITLLAHSMGNYLYKKTLMSSTERLSRGVVFDNVILKAADTNHAGHAAWVERIRARRRVYVMINQDDAALRLSNMKIGEEQKPRLGSTLKQQNASNATYIDLSPFLGGEHSYFHESDIKDPQRDARPLTSFFDKALNGEVAEEGLVYLPGMNTYRLG